jgi:hypothetical protein
MADELWRNSKHSQQSRVSLAVTIMRGAASWYFLPHAARAFIEFAVAGWSVLSMRRSKPNA